MSETTSYTTKNVETITGFTDEEFETLSVIDQEILLNKIELDAESEHLESIHAELMMDASIEEAGGL